MKLTITTPEEHLGDFVGDLQQRRSAISKTEHRGEMLVVESKAPLAELFGYSSAMRSLSQGRASCSMEHWNTPRRRPRSPTVSPCSFRSGKSYVP